MNLPAPQSVTRGTVLLLLGRITNRFLGLGREVLSAALFGTGLAMDCFNLSYTVVIGLRQLFSEQFLTPVVPTYFKRLKESGEEGALRSLQSITTRLNILTLIICAAIFIWAAQVVRLIAPGFSPEKLSLSTSMLRWFAVGGVAIILHRYYVGLYTCFFQFTVVAFAPLLLNIGAIAAMVFFAVKFGVVSLAGGISLGFLAYFFILVFLLPRRNNLIKPRWGRGDPGVSTYGLMILPLFMAVSVEQVQLFVDRALASGLPEGALSAQGYALRLVRMFSDFIMGTFGTVIFPVFSSLVASGKKEELARNFSLALQGVTLVMSLAAAIIIALSLPLVRIIFERGAFTFQDSVLTSGLIIYYTVAYAALALIIIVIRGFHAHGDTRTPMYTTVISVLVMIAADFLLVGPMGIFGLALALAIGYTLNLTLVYILFTRYLPVKMALENVKIILLGIALTGALGWVLARIWGLLEAGGLVESFPARVAAVLILAVLATVLYLSVLRMLRVPALEFLMRKIKQKRTPDIPSEPGEC